MLAPQHQNGADLGRNYADRDMGVNSCELSTTTTAPHKFSHYIANTVGDFVASYIVSRASDLSRGQSYKFNVQLVADVGHFAPYTIDDLERRKEANSKEKDLMNDARNTFRTDSISTYFLFAYMKPATLLWTLFYSL